MKYIKLGNSDLNVSRICLGCMTFGDQNTNNHSWLLNQEETDEIVKCALDSGINFFDTANTYNGGTSEIYLANSLKKYVKREDVIIATKVRFNEGGLSYEAIRREVELSLKRLQTSYIDLYIIHRWDYDTPIYETMKALNELIEEGKVRYIGASAMFSYQFFKAQEIARQNNFHTFISMQNHYNLLYREEEREMIQLLEEEKVVMTPYSPLAAGRLARSWKADTKRSQNDTFAMNKYDADKDIDLPICKRVEELAKKYNVTMGQISMAWLLSKPLVGVTKKEHLIDACKAVDLVLKEEDINYLEELYLPHRVVGAVEKSNKKGI